jgi:tRNA 5-methylaminomethyl-2-thiouridine biosynthesis bifunctional protein
MAQRHYGPLIEAGQLAGQAQGLLRLLEDTSPGELQALIDALGLPPEYAQACSAEQVAALLAMPSVNPQSACRFMGGGWIDPGAWVRWALNRASVQFQGGAAVHALQRTGADWTVLGAGGQVLARTRHVVLCAAADLLALLPSRLTAHWPVAPQRGQITQLPASQTPGPGPLRPVSGHGYALTLPNGDVLCGATSSEQDAGGDLRPEDHLYNLQRMNRLLGWCAAPAPASLGGRVGWRFQATDRLPIVGPVEAFTDAARSSSATRLRELPAELGLFAATALGSRGITWAPLVGAVIAHWIAGEPPPLPTSLLQAIDPRRFALRRSRKSTA